MQGIAPDQSPTSPGFPAARELPEESYLLGFVVLHLVSGTWLTEASSLDSMVNSRHSISLNLTSNLANKLQQTSQLFLQIQLSLNEVGKKYTFGSPSVPGQQGKRRKEKP